MPIPKLPMFNAWSYSRYVDYIECPLKTKCKYILKLPEPQSPAANNGELVHRQSAEYLTSKLKQPALPEAFARFEEEYHELRRLKPLPLVEQQWAFNRAWETCAWDDWTGCWLRIKVDIHYLLRNKILKIIDIKTGRIGGGHELQRSLYALGGLLQYPNVTSVEAEHWYLNEGQIEKDKWTANQLPKLQAQWMEKAKPMLTDTLFAPRPGPYCKWCAYRKEAGGPCVY